MSMRTLSGLLVSSFVLGLTACGAGGVNVRADDGTLTECSSAPHCVSSTSADPDRQVAEQFPAE